jgi:hypothetical protein
LEEENTTLEGMVDSHDELLMEIASETGLNHMGEDAEDEEEDENADDGEDAATPPIPTPPTIVPEEIMEEEPVEMVLEQEALALHEVILAHAEPEMTQPRLYHALMRDVEESPPRMMDDSDDLDDDSDEGLSNMDEWFSKDGSNDRD